MHSVTLTPKNLLLILALGLLSTNCQQKKQSGDEKTTQSEGDSAETENEDTEGSAEDGNATPGIDYPKLYCENVNKLKLKADISKEVGVICKDNAPTQQLLDFRTQAIEEEPGSFGIVFINDPVHSEDYKSEFMIAWAFHVPIRPFDVKERPLYEFISAGYNSDSITLNVTNNRLPDDQLESGLHLWSVDMTYDLTIKGTNNLELVNQRQTQYNLYQVLSGNEEMGLGVESLVDTANPDYSASTMVNFSFNDGNGFNDGKGGTVVVTVLRFVMNNQGFPATATRSIEEIARYLADQMYNGLKE